MPDVFRDALEELKAISELENDEPIKAPPEIIKKIKEQVTKFDEQLEGKPA